MLGLDGTENINEIRKLYRNISRRIDEIAGRSDTARFAVNHFREIEKEYGGYRNIRNLSDKDLKNLQKDLIRVNNMGSSTVRGAIKAFNALGGKSLYNQFDPQELEDIWDIYGKAVEGFEITNMLKYQIIEIISESYILGESDNIVETLRKAFEGAYESGGSSDRKVFVSKSYERLNRILHRFD